jgi:hypothetical protein
VILTEKCTRLHIPHRKSTIISPLFKITNLVDYLSFFKFPFYFIEKSVDDIIQRKANLLNLFIFQHNCTVIANYYFTIKIRIY